VSLDISQGSRLRPDPLDELAERIRTKRARVAIVGVGYVGLPMLVATARSGFPVLGVDIDHGRVRALRERRSYLVDVTDAELALLKDAEFETDPSALADADVILICVPTPLADHTPDLEMVRQAAQAAGRHLSPGRLVVLESTTYPGTTEEVVAPLLQEASAIRPSGSTRAMPPTGSRRPRRSSRATPTGAGTWPRPSTGTSSSRSSRRHPHARPRWRS
jgi:hypothetical protein